MRSSRRALARLLSYEVLAASGEPESAWVTKRAHAGKRSAVLIHGLLGSAKNWRGPAKKIAARNPDWQIISVDLRGHGETSASRSESRRRVDFPPPHSLASCAEDVAETLSHLGVRAEAVIGHSLGGKVALAFLELCREGAPAFPALVAPRQTWVLDSLPGPVERGEDATGRTNSVAHVLQSVGAIDHPLKGKRELVEELTADHGVALPIAQWMTTNVVEASGELRFAFDHSTCAELFKSYGTTDMLPLLRDVERDAAAGSAQECRVGVVRATRNEVWQDDSVSGPLLRAAGGQRGVSVHDIDAGHWVHVDNLPALLKILAPSMR